MKPPRPPAEPDSPKAAYFRALRWLTARELSEAQVRERLERRGYTGEAIAGAIERLKSERTLDDRRAAAAVARTEAAIRRNGPRRVMAKLIAMHIDRDLARDVIHDVFGEGDEQALLESTLDRRLRGREELLTDPAERRKLLAYLLRKGFSASSASALLRARARRNSR